MVADDPLSTGRMLSGVRRGGRRYSVGWSYFDWGLSTIQCKLIGIERIKITCTCFDLRTKILKHKIGNFLHIEK